MSQFIFIVLITMAAVAFFAGALFLPWLLKGHNRDAEIGTNRHMQERGIQCPAREEEADFCSGKSGEMSQASGECAMECSECAKRA